MNLTTSPYVFLYIITTFSTLIVATIAWQRRTVPGGLPMTLMLLAIAEWALCRVFELVALGVTAQVFWSKLQYIGSLSISVLLLIFTLEYSGKSAWVTRRNVACLLVIPTITVALAFTNEWHHLIWTSFTPSPAGMNILVYGHGPAFWLGVFAYPYTLTLIATLLLIRAAIWSHKIYQQRTFVLLLAIAVPWISNAVYIGMEGTLIGFDPNPIAFAIAGILATYALFRFGLLDLAPIARDALVEKMRDGVLVVDEQNRIVDTNPMFCQMLGCASSDLVGRPVFAVLPAWLTDALMRDVFETPTEIQANANQWFDVRISSLRDQHSKTAGHLVLIRDSTERHWAEQARQESETSYRGLFNSVAEAIYIQDREGHFLDVNDGALAMYGYPREFLIGQTPAVVAAPGKNDLEEIRRLVERAFEGEPQQFEFWGIRRNGEIFPKHVRLYPGTYFGQAVVIALAQDITERKRAEETLVETNVRLKQQIEEISRLHTELRALAIRDPLTQLFNRLYLNETLPRELARAARGGYSLGILMMDVDHFKDINDTFGHEAGDEALRTLATNIVTQVRASDIVCRYGGEELVCVLINASPDYTRQRAEEIRASIAALPIIRAEPSACVTLSIGVAMFPDHGATLKDILRAADDALYAAKAAGRNIVMMAR
ncbi:MAG: diguanylate cyclase [Chloroflexi bacterium]|nr:diguanylate cyclase [Chloroflexota bacterium]